MARASQLILFVLCTLLNGPLLASPSAEKLPLDIRLALARGDTDHAIRWLIPAASKGNAVAALKLANLYRSGDGVEKNPDRSLEYLGIAAKAGLADAQYLLGTTYSKLENIVAAERWLALASDQNHKQAGAALDELRRNRPKDIARLFGQTISPSQVPDAELNNASGEDLIQAIKQGHSHWVQRLISVKPSLVTFQDQVGNSALHHAVMVNKLAVVDPLLKAGANVNVTNHAGSTPLHIAIGANASKVIERLNDSGADWHLQDDSGWTPKMLTSRGEKSTTNPWSKTNTLQRLNAGADLESLLLQATRKGDADLVKQLIGRGPNLKATDNIGNTPLMLAVKTQHAQILDMLLGAGADPALPDTNGQTALMQAAEMANHKFVVRLLQIRKPGMQKSVSINALNNKGNTALHLAIMAECELCIAPLIKHGAQLNQLTANHLTPAMLAAKSGAHKVMELLIALKADINESDRQGRSPLWWACSKQHPAIVEQLVKANASFTADKNQVHPLHLAAQGNSEQMMMTLLLASSHEDIEARSRSGNTPLITASYHNNASQARMLLEQGAEIDAVRSNGETALMVAIRQKAFGAAELLVTQGASLQRRNENNESAEMLIQRTRESQWLALIDLAPSLFDSLARRFSND